MATLHPAYLLLGPETGRRDEFVAGLRAEITKQSGEEPEQHRFQGSEDSFATAEAVLRSPSLFQPHVLVLFYGAERIGGKEDGGRLKEYVKDPSRDATLVLVSEETRIDKAWAKSFPKAWTTIFWELFEDKKRSWLAARFRANKVRIEPEAEELFLELVENDTAQLGAEADRLSALAENGVITEDLVETYLYHGKSENVFSLFEAAAAGELTHSLDILQKLLLGNDSQPVQIVGGLLWQLRRVLKLRLLIDEGRSADDAIRTLNIRGKRNAAFHTRIVGGMSATHLQELVHKAIRCDADLRSLPAAAHTLLLERLVYEIASSSESAAPSAPGRSAAS